jgi:outer membrane protein
MKHRIVFLAFLIPVAGFSQNTGSYTLRYCIETALSNNITMKQTEATISSNKINLEQTKMSRYPNLNAAASQSINFGRSVNPYDNTVVANQQVNSNNLSLSSSVNLFNGFQNRNTIQQRKLIVKASEEDKRTTRNNIVLGVVEAFAGVLSNKAILKSSLSQFESTKAQIDRTEKLVQAGKLPSTNLFDLNAQLATEETNIVLAENNLEISKLNLAQWMQVDPSIISDVEEPAMSLSESDEKPAAEVYSVAEPNQPQILAARTRVISAEKGIEIARSGLYPSLNFQAGLFTNYSSVAKKYVAGAPLETPTLTPLPLLVQDVSGNTVPVIVNQISTVGPGRTEDLNFGDQLSNNLRKGFSFNVNIPIFNNMQNRYAIETARINRLNAQLQLDQQKNQLRQTIETAVTNEKAARKRLQAIEKQIKALDESFRSSEQRFNLGVMNPVDFLVSKNNLAKAQNDQARYRYDFFIRRALLDFYLGKELNFN